MHKKVLCFAAIVSVFNLSATISDAQLGVYEFDGGGDGTSWDDAANWAEIVNADGTAGAGNDPASPPDPLTAARVPVLGVVIDNTMPGQAARDVNIGTDNGAGSLSMSGGGLDSGDDIELGGGGNAGTMMMSGGSASTGDDFTINADSSLSMSGGTINIGDRLNMLDNATLNISGGEIIADDDFFFFGSSQITVDGGLMAVADKMRFDDVLTTGKLTINGGIVRAQEFGLEDDAGTYIMNGVTEINGTGALQIEENDGDDPVSQLTVASAKALINEGVHLTTSEMAPLKLGVSRVLVSDVPFIQIGVVPEPASALLMSLGVLGCLALRHRAR